MIIAINIHLPSLIVHQCHLSTPRVLWWVCLLAFLGLLLASLVWNAVEIFGWQQINLSQCTKYFQAKRCFLAALGSKIQTRSNDNSGSCCWMLICMSRYWAGQISNKFLIFHVTSSPSVLLHENVCSSIGYIWLQDTGWTSNELILRQTFFLQKSIKRISSESSITRRLSCLDSFVGHKRQLMEQETKQKPVGESCWW